MIIKRLKITRALIPVVELNKINEHKMRLSYKRNSRFKAELNWFQSRTDAAKTQTQSGSQKKAFNKFRFAMNIEHEHKNGFFFLFLSFVHMVMTHAHIACTQLKKKNTYMFDFLRWGSIFSIQQTYFVFYFDVCLFMCVCASCWWNLYLWIVYVAKFKTCDKNLNAAWTATMKWGKKRSLCLKTRKMKRKALNKING